MSLPPKTAARPVRKGWNFSVSQTEALYSLLERVLEPLGSSALVLPEGVVLHIRPSGPADFATFPQAASLCHQYLRLKDGDVAMLNDPYSGGTTLSEFTLVMGVNFEGPGSETDVLLVRRLALQPRFSGTNRLDDEGVRVPPTPLVSDRELNAELLAAVAAHPMSPPGLGEAIEKALTGLEEARLELKAIGRDPGTEFKKANFKRYFADSSRAFESRMNRLPLGTTIATTQLASGETVKLSLAVTESRIQFDFAGTDASPTVGLTEVATFGACVAAIASLIHDQIPMNAGSFEHIQVSTPAKTLLSSRAPTGMFRGLNEGVAIVAGLVQTAFAKLNSAMAAGSSAGADSHLQLTFTDGRIFSLRASPGKAAQRNAHGTEALALWAPRYAYGLSLEAAESKYPIKWLSAGVRAASGGKGQRRGGDGSMRSFAVQAPGKLRWILGPSARKQEGGDGGRAGLPSSIEIVRSGGEREEFLTPEGEVSLAAGDQVHILTCGGGGFGEVAD